jgi:hypothetical protein
MRTRPPFARLAAVLLFAHATYAPLARADGDDLTTLLLRGFELRRQHRNEEALAVYDQAFALSPTPAVRAQRALAEQSLGHWLVAERELDLAFATDDPWVARNRESLDAARAIVSQHLAWLTVDVDVANADIRLDGEPLQQGVAARVVAGAGVLEVRAPGRVLDIRRVSFAPSEHVHKEIRLAPLVDPSFAVSVAPAVTTPPASLVAPIDAAHPPSQLEPVAPPAGDRSAIPVLPITLGVLGLASLGVGSYFGIRTGQDKSAEIAACPGGRCTQAAANDYSDAQTSATASTVAFGAGAALLVGGAVVWILERRSGHAAKHALEIAPAFGVGMNGLVVRGSL